MGQSAALLVDDVLKGYPIRSWVLSSLYKSFPFWSIIGKVNGANMSKVVEFKHHHSTAPTIENRKVLPLPAKYSQVREREYLLPDEVSRSFADAFNF
jgi:hypothetical protein